MCVPVVVCCRMEADPSAAPLHISLEREPVFLTFRLRIEHDNDIVVVQSVCVKREIRCRIHKKALAIGKMVKEVNSIFVKLHMSHLSRRIPAN